MKVTVLYANDYEEKDMVVEKDTLREVFVHIYERNRRLRYCNGTYWKVKPEHEKQWSEFYNEYDTMSNYYGSGTVD